MKSGLRRLRNQAGGPPVPLAGRKRSLMFDLGAGKASREAMMRAYGQSGTVFSIVSLLQQSSAGVPWHLYKKAPQDGRRRYAQHGDEGSDQRVEVVQHAALSLWYKPNDFHSGFEFREGSNQHQELTGETLWVLNREGTSFPTAMWYVRPDRMEPVPDPDDFLIGWFYTGPNGESVPLRVDEVIIEKLPDPLDPFRGAGPVASIMPNIQQQRYATDYQRNLFLNGADPGGVITVPSRLTDPQFDELIDRWREAHQGVARAGRVGVLENGATWAPGGQTNKDLEYGNLRLANRDELREAWRMHKAMLGTVDDVNRANAETAEEIFGHWQTIPRLERRKDTLNCKFLPMFGKGQEDIYEFDYDNPVPESREQVNAELVAKASAAQTLVAAGFDSHDVLEVVGLPEMRWSQPTGGEGAGEAQADDDLHVNPGKYVSDRQQVTLTNKKDARAKVLQQLAEDYPPEAMAWAHHASWTGPVTLPADYFEPDMEYMDQADPKHVDDFVREIRQGRKLKPVIAVKTPSAGKPKLADGHHRYLADKQERQPVRAYIATVDSDHGPWETMHNHQLDGGNRRDDGESMANLLRRVLSDGYVPVELGRH